eukprot:s8213_g1.t1
MKSASWVACRALRTVGDDGQVTHTLRREIESAPISSLKLKPENIPRHPGQQDVAAYFPHGEMAVTNLIEGQLAFLQHVHLYEEKHRGTHILQTRLLWKYEFLRCCFGCLPREELESLSREIDEIGGMNHRFTSWSVKTSKLLSAVLRHNSSVTLGKYLEASIEDLHTKTKLKCFDWEPKKFFAFLAANSKNRFSIWISPAALTFSHFVYAGGSVSPGAGTVIKYGSFMFYAQLDYVTYLQHGHELYLTSNGMVLSYKNVAPMYLTHHYQPPHEKDPGGLKYEQKQQGAGVGPSQDGGTSSASASASAAGSSPQREEPARGSNKREAPHRGGEEEAGLCHNVRGIHKLCVPPCMVRTNPWHLFKSGLLQTTYGDPLVRTTPFHRLPASLKDALGGEYNPASWLQHPLSGFGVHFFLKAFELGNTGNYLVEFNQKPKAYSDGYLSPWEKHRQRPLIPEIGFRPPTDDDPRARKPKADEADFAEKLKAHDAFLMERDVCMELGYVREDSCLLESFNAPYILASLERALSETEGQNKDFKSAFARKAKRDLIAYESLKAKREAELEELQAAL